jgi:hypothetical protein
MVAEHYIQSPNLECGVLQLMSQEDLPFSIRENCIRSMFHLFERLFAQEPLETSVQMWWDSLCYDWHCGNRSRAKGGEDQLMQDVLFQTLSRILELDSVTCQGGRASRSRPLAPSVDGAVSRCVSRTEAGD